MGWVDLDNVMLPTALGSARYLASAAIQTLTSAAGVGNRKAAQIGKVWWKDKGSHDCRYIVYLSGAVTADATAKLRTSIQGKAATFNPDGTILNAGVGTANAYADNDIPAASSLVTVDLGVANSPTLAHGQKIAIVQEISNTGAGTASVAILTTSTAGHAGTAGCTGWNGAAWAATGSALPNIILIATDGTYGRVGPLAGGNFTTTAYNSTSVGPLPTKVAAVFTAPFDMLVDGCHVGITAVAAGAAFDVVMRDMDGTQIGANTESFTDGSVVTTTQPFVNMMNPDGSYLLRRGESVMYSLDATNANALTIGTITHMDAAANALQSMGTFVGLRYYIDGAWGAVDPLSRPAWNLIVSSQFLPGLGGGGRIGGQFGVVEVN